MTSTMAYLAKVFIKAIGASRVSCAQLDEDSKHELQEKDDAAQVVLEPAARVEVEELEAAEQHMAVANCYFLGSPLYLACGVCHVGIEVNGHEWSFGGSGVEPCSPRRDPDFPYSGRCRWDK